MNIFDYYALFLSIGLGGILAFYFFRVILVVAYSEIKRITRKPIFNVGDTIIFNQKIGKRKSLMIYKIVGIDKEFARYKVETKDGRGGLMTLDIEWEMLEKYFTKMTTWDSVLYHVKL